MGMCVITMYQGRADTALGKENLAHSRRGAPGGMQGAAEAAVGYWNKKSFQINSATMG